MEFHLHFWMPAPPPPCTVGMNQAVYILNVPMSKASANQIDWVSDVSQCGVAHCSGAVASHTPWHLWTFPLKLSEHQFCLQSSLNTHKSLQDNTVHSVCVCVFDLSGLHKCHRTKSCIPAYPVQCWAYWSYCMELCLEMMSDGDDVGVSLIWGSRLTCCCSHQGFYGLLKRLNRAGMV